MRTRILVTHSQIPTQSSLNFLESYGIECIWKPALKVLTRRMLPTEFFDLMILSSPTSIYWAHAQGVRAAQYWTIGPQTADLLKECGLTPVFRLDSPPYTLRNLLDAHDSYFRQRKCLWLGSHQGVLRYLDMFETTIWLTPFVTHWNWPIDYHQTLASVALERVDAVIISCQHAAISLSTLQWDYAPLILVSHERLVKYLNTTIPRVNVVNTTWIQDIVYTYYKHLSKYDYGGYSRT